MKTLKLLLVLTIFTITSCTDKSQDPTQGNKVTAGELRAFLKKHNIQSDLPADLADNYLVDLKGLSLKEWERQIVEMQPTQNDLKAAEEMEAFNKEFNQVKDSKELLKLYERYPTISNSMKKDMGEEQFNLRMKMLREENYKVGHDKNVMYFINPKTGKRF